MLKGFYYFALFNFTVTKSPDHVLSLNYFVERIRLPPTPWAIIIIKLPFILLVTKRKCFLSISSSEVGIYIHNTIFDTLNDTNDIIIMY